MERDNFNPYRFESSAEKPGDKKEDGKKKAKSATGLGKLLARQEQPKETDKPLSKEEQSFLQKLAAESVKVEAGPEPGKREKAEPAVPLEELSEAEQAETAQAYIKERARELSDEAEATDQPLETDADATFLAALHDRLEQADTSADIEAAIEDAFEDAVAEVGSEGFAAEANAPNAEQLEPQDFAQDEAVALAGGGHRPPPEIHTAGGGFAERPDEGPLVSPMPRQRQRTAAAEQSYTVDDVQRIERSAAGRGLLVGGILGYLIGRRRGRIKTEKRLKTVQDRLEKQVAAIQQKIEEKEVAIRQLARERDTVQISRDVPAMERLPSFVSRAPEASQAATVSERLTRPPAPERGETPPAAAETAQVTVDALSKTELLAYSAQIRVGETSLRRVFEAKMVDEKGLRRLIKEYQAGHDLRRALAREFMVKELRFERDPTLRDLLPPEAQPRKQENLAGRGSDYGDNGGPAGANGGPDSANRSGGGTDGKRSQPAISRPEGGRQRQENVSPALLIGLTLVTIGLALYAIWLTVTK